MIEPQKKKQKTGGKEGGREELGKRLRRGLLRSQPRTSWSAVGRRSLSTINPRARKSKLALLLGEGL